MEGAVSVVDHIWCPDVGCAVAVVEVGDPFFSFGGNLAESPACKFPVYEVGALSHLHETEFHAVASRFVAVFAEDCVGGIHVKSVAHECDRRVVDIIGSPAAVVVHG